MSNKTRIHFNQVSEGMSLVDFEQIKIVIQVLSAVRQQGKRVYVCGNGGSHATASHFVNDLIKQNHMKAQCIGNEVPTMLAFGNDDGWEYMYSNAIEKQFEEGDCVFGISCGGNSENVTNAMKMARIKKGFAVGLTGISNRSVIATMDVDGLVFVPVPDIRVQEDIHMMVCHAIVRTLQDER
jgi:D-sedoheptulose 7-phosphate isomerase